MLGMNYFFCILGILFGQMCLAFCACKVRKATHGIISFSDNKYHPGWYNTCWSIVNSDKNELTIQLISLNLGNQSLSDGALAITLKPERKNLFYGSQSPKVNFTTTSPAVEIWFMVNVPKFPNGTDISFSLSFKQDCGGVYTNLTGILKSPYYPDYYPALSECVYKIRTSPGYIINITFDDMSIEDDPFRCRFDYIKIHDGDKNSSSVIAQICGSIVPEPILSTGNFLRLTFRSDGNREGRGFHANYTVVETDRIVGMPTRKDIQKEDGEIITEDSRKILETSSTQDNIESGAGSQELCPCETGTTELTKKDLLKMEVKEHELRLEVIELQKEVLELQKRYEINRNEFLKNFENERMSKLRQLENDKTNVSEF